MSVSESAPTLRAYSRTASGVHVLPTKQAAALIRPHLGGRVEGDEQPPLVWLDISNPGTEEEEFLRSEIGFHPLAVEDCVRGRQRPKLDRYRGYFFLVIYAADVNADRGRMALKELHIFLGANFIVTVHDHRVREVGEVLARWRAAPQQFEDVSGLAHQLLDVVVDDYFDVIEHFAGRLEELETDVFHQDTSDRVSEILDLRHELILFRRVVAPQRDVLSTIVRRDLPFLQPALVPYFQDVHDHIMRVTEEIDSLRELLSALLDAHLSSSAQQLGNIMKIMTAWSIILMSMTLVAGIYGMNFVFMPELEWRWGYFGSLAAMGAIGLSLALFFRRRGWL